MKGVLSSFFKFDSANDLVRIGKDYDGGYLVSTVDIDKSEVLIGLGINYDWSFEENFLKHKNVPVFAYDASINKLEILKNIINSLIRLKKTTLLYWVNVYFSYKQFFRKDRICCLVIEFHDCDIHLAKIKNFVEEFGLRLIHIHANNFEPMRIYDDLPKALELTFSKNSKVRKLDSLPHILDMPNDKFAEEIKLEFEN